MSALTIMLIRHAEKPNDPDLGPGLTPQGQDDDHSLVVRGWQRAGAWTALFGSGVLGADYPAPGAVYAADPNKAPTPDGSVSQRPFETVTPLCARLGFEPVTTYGVGDEAALLNGVQKLTGTVLICWEHKRIASAILPQLGKDQPQLSVPTKWPGSRFDVVLRFDRARSGAPWSFRQLCPKLLDGDLDIPF